MKCSNCKRNFPSELVQPMFIDGGYMSVCGVCALEIRNEAFGLPEGTPFGGEMAQEIYEETLEYLKGKK